MYTGAKELLPNQHDLLHPFYGEDDCCLCKAEASLCKAEARIRELETAIRRVMELETDYHVLEQEIIDLKKQLKALSESYSEN